MASQLQRPPEKLSDLIWLAIGDARALDRDQYVPDYSAWHQLTHNNLCRICLAGAVMARTVRLCISETGNSLFDRDGTDNDEAWKDAFYALNHIREGRYLTALDTYYGWAKLEALENIRVGFSEEDSSLESWAVGLSGTNYPDYVSFMTWDEFDTHLESLEDVARAFALVGF